MSQISPPTGGAGINDRFVGADDMLVSRMEWQRLARLGAVIGECRSCSAPLRAIPADEHDHSGEDGAISWYEARCDRGHEVASPNGRVLRKSTLHSEAPSGWWAEREKRDDLLRKDGEPEPEKGHGKRY